MAYSWMHDAEDKSIRDARGARYSPVAQVGIWLGLVSALMLTGAKLNGCPTPVCNGACGAPADADDCAMCCGGRTSANDCCNDSYEQGSPEWSQCSRAVNARWPSVGGPAYPPTDGGVVIFDVLQ